MGGLAAGRVVDWTGQGRGNAVKGGRKVHGAFRVHNTWRGLTEDEA